MEINFNLGEGKCTKKIAGKLLTLLSGRYIVFYNIILGRLDVVYRPKVVSSTIIVSEQIRCYFSKFFSCYSGSRSRVHG